MKAKPWIFSQWRGWQAGSYILSDTLDGSKIMVDM
jgi:hypothetical protein